VSWERPGLGGEECTSGTGEQGSSVKPCTSEVGSEYRLLVQGLGVGGIEGHLVRRGQGVIKD
jgi:hypothetical protein